MNMTPVWSPLHIADAADLMESGFFGTTMAEVKDGIRTWLGRNRAESHALIARSGTQSDKVTGVALITVIDRTVRRVIINAFSVFDNNENESFKIECLQSLLSHLFFTLGYWRVEFPVAVSDRTTRICADNAKMLDEGLLTGVLVSGDRHEDARSLYMLRPQFPSYGYGFVPFEKGLICIAGNHEQVDRVVFIHFGSCSDCTFLMESLEYAGCIDEAGKVQTPGDPVLLFERSPDEVQRACKQIEEYLCHRRGDFDIRIRQPENATLFQQRVWKILSDIGYGQVWTYEDVAARLVDNDRVQARKMARAVGSACAANPVALLVPCHRVIGKDKKLVGFSGGVDVKEFLLEHEWIMPTGDTPVS